MESRRRETNGEGTKTLRLREKEEMRITTVGTPLFQKF